MCGCNKKSAVPRRRTLQPGTGPQSIRSAGATPSEVRALGMQSATGPGSGQTQRLDEQRRRVEKLRRDAIKRKLG